MTEDLTLPSGARLKITLAPFTISKALYQAMLEELKGLKLDPQAEIDANLFKDIFCVGFSSKKIEAALHDCLKRVLYNDVRISDATFEDPAAREDYLPVLLEVARINIRPFTKNLLSVSTDLSAMMGMPLAAQSTTKPS